MHILYSKSRTCSLLAALIPCKQGLIVLIYRKPLWNKSIKSCFKCNTVIINLIIALILAFKNSILKFQPSWVTQQHRCVTLTLANGNNTPVLYIKGTWQIWGICVKLNGHFFCNNFSKVKDFLQSHYIKLGVAAKYFGNQYLIIWLNKLSNNTWCPGHHVEEPNQAKLMHLQTRLTHFTSTFCHAGNLHWLAENPPECNPVFHLGKFLNFHSMIILICLSIYLKTQTYFPVTVICHHWSC